MLVIFSGGSGVGKNTIINSLMEDDRFDLMPTYTTRGKRENESEGKPYFFISKEEFEAKIEEGKELYEYNLVHGNYYGASRKLYNDKAKSGKILLKDIDVEGTQNLVNTLGKEVPLLTFFFRVDSKEILEKRLRERNEHDVEKRLARYELEQTFQNKYDYIITNNDRDETVSFCNDIIDYTIAGKKPIATKAADSFDMDKVNEIAKAIQEDFDSVEPVMVAVKNHEIYIVDGHHRYLASVLCGRKIAAYVVISDEFDDSIDRREWQALIEKLEKQK